MKINKINKVNGNVNVQLKYLEIEFLDECMVTYAAVYGLTDLQTELRIDMAKLSRR